MRTQLLTIVFTSFCLPSLAQAPQQISIMPMPSSLQIGSGQLLIDQSFSVELSGQRDALLDRAVQRFVAQLSHQTGMLFHPSAGKSQATLSLKVERAGDDVPKLGEDESYQLTVTTSAATLSAPNRLGILHGLQTFLQLLQTTPNGFVIPAVVIDDRPRFPWRGLLIDVGRHYIPVDVLKRNIDAMAAVKFNVLHLHLSDDQGFRVESKRYPKLHEMGSDGLYYTQAEIKDLIAYARDRGIRIMPEFDMPAHSLSWFVGYPELASTPGKYRIDPDAPYTVMDPTKEETYKFLDKFIGEMAKLFPDAYFHVGGDEVNGKSWDDNPKIQAFMHDHGIKNNQDLQAYFNQRLQKIVSKRHKIMVGWDEILRPDLPKTILVQSWRGQESLAAAAQQGYSGILSFGYYLDLMWPASRHYAVEPMSGPASTLSPEQKGRILGGEACMWGEWLSPENIDAHIWPRAAAIAERLWSAQDVTDAGSMYARLDEFSWRLEWLGLTHKSHEAPMLRRMAGTNDIEALQTLADVVEPAKDYSRMSNIKGVWDFRAPLNRLVDDANPESETARQFKHLVRRYIESKFQDREAGNSIGTLLTTWRDNDEKLQSTLTRSFLLREVAPLSQELSMVGTTGLVALTYLDKSQRPPEEWTKQQLAQLDAAKAEKADLLLTVVEPVEQLVQAATGPSQQ
ncbi:MAG TPA: family 20 glycosylhydrolase [Candidatus Udaeobacter sp.]|nr:family 20 glycosylhydrolase [Candidatus Udaeobacter sp.]